MKKSKLLCTVAAILFSAQPSHSVDEAVKDEFMRNGFKYAEQLGLLDNPDKKLEFMRNMANNMTRATIIQTVVQGTDNQETPALKQPIFINSGNGNMFVNYKSEMKGEQNVKK